MQRDQVMQKSINSQNDKKLIKHSTDSIILLCKNL